MSKDFCKLPINLISFFCFLIRSVIVMKYQKLLLFIALLSQWVWTFEQQPTLECFTDGLRLYFTPEGPFQGHIYVKGYFMEEGCHSDYTDNPIDRPFYFSVLYSSACHVQCEVMVREPSGINYNAVIIVQHHFLFLTQADRAYSANCFYQNIVDSRSQEMEVNGGLTMTELEGQIVPNCVYEVLMDSVDGEPVRFAQVGDRLVHKWSCETEVYGILIHSCFVHNTDNESFQLIDDQGCVTDRTLMSPLIYDHNLKMAYSVVPAFRFANQLTISFQCKVTFCIKARNGCEGISPPRCEIISTPAPEPLIPISTSEYPVSTSTSDSPIPTLISESSETDSETHSADGLDSAKLKAQYKHSANTTSSITANTQDLICSNTSEGSTDPRKCRGVINVSESSTFTTPEKKRLSYRRKRFLNGSGQISLESLIKTNSTNANRLTMNVNADQLLIFERKEINERESPEVLHMPCEVLRDGMFLQTVIFVLLIGLLLAIIFVQKICYNKHLAKCDLTPNSQNVFDKI
uniref:ZP domain-containing protein n=1 Tax=Elaeophora elaphi TaxID=1147741 RepID=A0A0R3RJP9_9BILA